MNSKAPASRVSLGAAYYACSRQARPYRGPAWSERRHSTLVELSHGATVTDSRGRRSVDGLDRAVSTSASLATTSLTCAHRCVPTAGAKSTPDDLED
jgi:hypothetical protein